MAAIHDLDSSRATWRTSTYSGNGGNCVEVANNLPAVIAVRDSKNPSGPRLVLASEEWRRFTARVRAGRFGQR
jgi:hypothetical protein